jgi:DNA-directed RNA polymerase subunit RPC12/RpoP
MFTVVTCPACQHKLTLPEGAMGKRQTCPNCHTPFVAGKSVAEKEAEISMKLQPQGPAGYQKTMLGEAGETAPPIKFNCPRCKKPLEAPASEALIKKPCPECGQRLQVPAAPAPTPTPAASNLNKTMMASDESKPQPPIKYNCPNCKKPLESPASEALTKKPCPACGQRLQVPAAPPPGAGQPNLNKTILASDESRPQSTGVQAGAPLSAAAMQTVPAGQAAPAAAAQSHGLLYMIGGIVIAGFGFLVLLTCILALVLAPGAKAEKDKYEQAQKELEKLKQDIELRKVQMDKEMKEALDKQKEREAQRAKDADDQKRFEDRLREIQASALDRNAKKEEEARVLAEKKKADKDAQDRDDRFKELELKLKQQQADTQAALDRANQQRTTIIQAAPPPVYYRYHPYYGWGYY